MIKQKFYRPVWTSGRYDKSTHSAIFYNLFTGVSYFFEDISADVVGHILKQKRNGLICINKIHQETDIAENDIINFLNELKDLGLVTNYQSTRKTIEDIKENILCKRTQQFPTNNNEIDSEIDYQKRVKSKVFSVLFELTYNCSEKCIHCYNPGRTRNEKENSTRNREELDLDEYKNIIDQLYEQGLVRVSLSGGDPFSKPIIWDIIEYLYAKDIVFDVYTNGQNLLNKEVKLASYFPATVGISIYSDIAKVHDSITRINGSLNNSLKVIDKLFSLHVPLAIKCCVMKQNIKTYRGVKRLAQKYHATYQLECNIFDSVDGDACVSYYLRLSPEEMKIVLRDKDNPLYIGSEIKNYGSREFKKNQNVCGAGYAGFCITPSGHLTYCVSFPSVIGNLRSEKLIDILRKEKLLQWRNRTLEDYTECTKYDYCNFCPLCPGLNFTKNGDPFKPSDNNCYIAKIRHEVFQLLQCGQDPLNGNDIDTALSLLPEPENITIKKIQETNFYQI